MLKDKVRPGLKHPLNDQEKQYITDHYTTKSVPEIGTFLKRDTSIIYRFLDQHRWQAFSHHKNVPPRAVRKPARSGFFDMDNFKGMF